MLTVALVSRTTREQREDLLERFDCELHDLSENRDGLAALGDVIEVVYGNVRPFELPQMKALKWIQTSWSGVENLCYPEMKQAGVIVTNVRGQNATSMSEHAIAGLLYFAREFHRHVEGCRRREKTPSRAPFHVAGSTICVMGTGGVGSMVIQKLTALGAKVIGVNIYGRPTEECADVCTLETIRARLGEIDHLILTLPATPKTRGIIGRDFLTGLREGAVLCNIGRGALVVEADLAASIESGQIGGAMIDVSDPEPPHPDSPLWNNPKVLFTSHTSWGPSGEPGKGGFDTFCRNLPHYLKGEFDRMINRVDLSAGY